MFKIAKKRYTAAQRKAYWIGVGINAERYGDSNWMLEHSNAKIRYSTRCGYNDENTKYLTRVKFKNNRPK